MAVKVFPSPGRALVIMMVLPPYSFVASSIWVRSTVYTSASRA